MREKILIIDDDSSVRDSIKQTLLVLDHELIFADNGQSGLEACEAHQPILIVLDLRMPILNGVDFLKKFSAKDSQNCAVIVLTGHGQDDDIKKCFELGVEAFLNKPFNIYQLIGMAHQLIRQKQKERVLKTKVRQFDYMKDHLDKIASAMATDYESAKEQLKGLQNTLNLFQKNDALPMKIQETLKTSPTNTDSRSEMLESIQRLKARIQGLNTPLSID